MQPNFSILSKAEYVVGNPQTVVEMVNNTMPMRPFSELTADFLNALSRKLMTGNGGFSDVSTFGFWCRKAHILKEKEKYSDCNMRLGRGIAFHSTPSNVAVNFAFSLAAGLLAGNANIIRLPAKPFEQVNIICSAINDLLNGDFGAMRPYICMLKFPPDRELYDIFSSICDTRVIWGGNNTVAEIRGSQLPPRANEITFADRFSVLIINSNGYLDIEDKERAAVEFYNDTYFTDQNACTSPRIILWYGDNIAGAKELFWENVSAYAERYELQPVQAVGKLHAFCKAAVNENIKLVPTKNNIVTRINVDEINNTLMDYKYNSGFYYEYDITDFAKLRPLFTRACQTLSYIGFDKDELYKLIMELRPVGIDRIVPVGKTMDFALMWDGNDLIRIMSRIVDLV